MRPLAFISAFLFLVPLAHAKPPPVNGVAWIGGLELHFNASRWDVNGADNAYDIYCKTSGCAPTTIAVTVADGTDACAPAALAFDDRPSADAAPPVAPGRVDRFSHAGLSFLVTEGSFGCRTPAGGPVRACTAHGGKTYLFDAPGQGCKTDIRASRSVDEILRGLKPR